MWQIGTEECTLAYCVKLYDGTALSLSWCPTANIAAVKGKKAIGLLACASSYGRIDIFSMPKPKPKSTVYDGEVLSLFKLCYEEVQPTCLEWSRKYPHNYLVAGMSNGSVNVWNVSRFSPGEQNPPCQVLNPSSAALLLNQFGPTFAAARAGIIDITTCPSEDHFVASLGMDAHVKVWDMR